MYDSLISEVWMKSESILAIQYSMRASLIFVKDPLSVKEYAYCEEKNESYRQEMEDNFVAQDNLTPDHVGFFAILDGHGGKDVSQYCALHLPEIFQQEYVKESQNIKGLFTTICQRVDQQIKNINSGQRGSTCCLVLVRQQHGHKVCFIGNLGDTRAIICTDKHIARRVSIDHKVSNPSEVDRIKSEGGSIIKGRVAGQLAITRALGDLELKPYGVSNVPDYEEILVDQRVQYMVVASDGLWDVCQDQEAVELCKNCISSKDMAKKLTSYALSNGSKDNISVLVIKL